MKIEKLTDNKIRIIVNINELSNNKIDLNDFMLDNIKSQKFFLDILNKAEKEIGFYTDDCKLLIESFSSIDEIFIFTITKLEKTKKVKNIKITKNKNPNLNINTNVTANANMNKTKIIKNPIYKFSNFEEFCNLCIALKKFNISIDGIAKKISLFYYKNTYYLIFLDLNLSYTNFRKLFSLLSEFSYLVKNSDNFLLKLSEYGKPIISKNAFKTISKYFS